MSRRFAWAVLLALSSGFARAQAPAALDPVHWTAQMQTPGVVRAGSRFAVLLHAAIDDGWHLYALPERDSFPLATEIGIAKTASVELLRIDEEKPRRSVDPESHVVTGWFARSTTFTLRLVTTMGASPRSLDVLVHYQACNERMCLPARQVLVPVQISAVQ